MEEGLPTHDHVSGDDRKINNKKEMDRDRYRIIGTKQVKTENIKKRWSTHHLTKTTICARAHARLPLRYPL